MGVYDKQCSIIEVLDKVDSTGMVKVFADTRGYENFVNDNSFYIWTEEYASPDDICFRIFPKDIAIDVNGLVYVVDTLEVMLLG